MLGGGFLLLRFRLIPDIARLEGDDVGGFVVTVRNAPTEREQQQDNERFDRQRDCKTDQPGAALPKGLPLAEFMNFVMIG